MEQLNNEVVSYGCSLFSFSKVITGCRQKVTVLNHCKPPLTSAVIHIFHPLHYDFQALKEAVFLYLIKNETKVKFSIVV